mgnify:CR=1 FL=1
MSEHLFVYGTLGRNVGHEMHKHLVRHADYAGEGTFSGILYRVADELGATKIALGHHRDDIVETLFLNMFFGARLKAMPPKLKSDDGKHVVIRPLAYCAERDIARYAPGRDFPIIPCNLCGSQENMKRREVKAMLASWESEDPGRTDRLFRSLQNVTPSHLADRELFDFEGLTGADD